jgi:hypothetical protein
MKKVIPIIIVLAIIGFLYFIIKAMGKIGKFNCEECFAKAQQFAESGNQVSAGTQIAYCESMTCTEGGPKWVRNK